MTYHADSWVIARPAWDFDGVGEPIAAAAEACRTDPFVTDVTAQLEEDVMRIAEMLELKS